MEQAIRADITVDVIGETCPIPLVEMRKAVMKARKGEVIEVRGTHKASQKEVPMAVNSLGLEILEESVDAEGVWHILFRK